jgi:acyl-CoA thioester hydrolase
LRFVHHCAVRWSDLDAYGHVDNARFLTLYEEARVALMFVEAAKAGVATFEQAGGRQRAERSEARGQVTASGWLGGRQRAERSEARGQVTASGWLGVIARHEVDYLRSVDYADRVRIAPWVEEIRPNRFVVAYELYDADEVASRARTVCVPFDLATRRPRRLSTAEREFLEPWQV